MPQNDLPYIYKNTQSKEELFNVWLSGVNIGASGLTQLAAVYYNEYNAQPYISKPPSNVSNQPYLAELESDEVDAFNKYIRAIPKIIAKMRLSGAQNISWMNIADLLEIGWE